MKKERISTAEHNEELAQKLEEFKKRVSTKPVRQNTKIVKKVQKSSARPVQTDNKTLYRIEVSMIPKPQDIKGDTVYERTESNIKNWHHKRNIDIERVRQIAYQLNQKRRVTKPAV